MTFKTDRTSLVEGEVITVEWDCLDAERVELSIDNGFKASVVPLEKSGTKRTRKWVGGGMEKVFAVQEKKEDLGRR